MTMEVSREAMLLSLLWWVVVEPERIAERIVRRLAVHFSWEVWGLERSPFNSFVDEVIQYCQEDDWEKTHDYAVK